MSYDSNNEDRPAGRKRHGRFIKRDSKVMEKVSLEPFSFEEINDNPVVAHDNAERSIIHTRYHSPQELGVGVKLPEKFTTDLIDPGARRAVLRPFDFTADWERDRKMRKDRVRKMYDEDDLAFEFSRRSNGEDKNSNTAAISESDIGTTAADTQQAETGVAEAAAEANEQPYQSIDVVGQAINNLGQDGAAQPEAADGSVNDAFIPVSQPAPAQEATPTAQDQAAPTMAPTADPVTEQVAAAAAYDPEEEAARRYREQLTDRRTQERLADIEEQAQSSGYADGFKVGEQKAELQFREQSRQMFSKVAELIHEFERLKFEILDNVQANFHDLCQALAEGLLHREFKIDPKAFEGVVRRAIAEGVGSDTFKIRLHPETLELISRVADDQIKDTLVADERLEPFDFKVESNLSVVDVSVRKLINQMLDQADIEIIERNDSGEKAG